MNTELSQKKANFEKDFFELMYNAVFGKNYGKCEKTQRHQTCHKKKKRRNCLVSEPNYHTANFSLKIYQQQK